MTRPTTTSMMIAAEWLSHVTSYSAWDDMEEVLRSEPERAWRLILALVGSAPDYGVMSAVAAGPVEDLVSYHGERFMPLIAEEAARNARFRICLSGVYCDLPPAVQEAVEAERADVRDLPVEAPAPIHGADLGLMTAWLHHSDTALASELLKEMNERDPHAAWDVLQVLARFAEDDERCRQPVFDEAFAPFLRKHFDAFREELVRLAGKTSALRAWVRNQKRPPILDDALWAAFAADVSAT